MRITYEKMYNDYVINKKSMVDLAKEYGVSNVTIKNWLKKYQIPIRSHKENQSIVMNKKSVHIDKNELEKVYSNNSIAFTAEYFGYSSCFISKKLDEYNIPKRSLSDSVKMVRGVEKPIKEDLDYYYNYLNYTTYRIGDIFGASDTLVGSWLKDYDIEIRSGGNTSQAERDLRYWLNNLGFNFKSTRKILDNNFELDGYDYPFAFEYCGLYWHCEKFRSKNYHYNKLKECRSKNIRLFTIFEDEWLFREKQIKSFLKASLGKNNIRIGARECKIVDLDKDSYQDFLEKNHIQGKTINHETNRIGLIHDKHGLVGVMGISSHHRGKNQLTLNRLCFENDITVNGGFSKMLKYAPKPLITWSDNRWSEGHVYYKNGFILEEELKPDYSYVNPPFNKRKSKQSCTKKNLGADFNQTEHQRALELGYYRIYDCGKKRWRLEK